MTPEIAEIIGLIKWSIGGACAMVVMAAGVIWRLRGLVGKLEKVDQIHVATQCIPVLQRDVAQVIAVQAKQASMFPKIDRRLYKVEMVTGVEDTGRFGIVPNGED